MAPFRKLPLELLWAIDKHELEKLEAQQLDHDTLEYIRREIYQSGMEWISWCSRLASMWLVAARCGDSTCLSRGMERFNRMLANETDVTSLYDVQEMTMQRMLVKNERVVDVLYREIRCLALRLELQPLPNVVADTLMLHERATTRRMQE